ncbi:MULTISPECIES: hypothetical protein [unclassified Mesorhizobium]|uniref:hypothetical protein n=1 Tax=unclassified Mesorhizobium TaxID=325217 RepID=UPI001FDF3194|nr:MULTISPECIES: hypothetical protein [unclassified Mesorhizobium]
MAPLADPSVLADDPAQSLKFLRDLIVQFNDLVEGIGDIGIDTFIDVVDPDGKVASPEGF